MKIQYGDKVIELDKENLSVRNLLRELKLNPEEVIVLKNGQAVTEDEKINKDDEVEIIRVISGGL